MYNFDDALKYLTNKLPAAGFAVSGSSFYRNIGGSAVVVSVPRVDGPGFGEYCESIKARLTGFRNNPGIRATAFVFVIPDESGFLGRGTDAYNYLLSVFNDIYRAGVVCEFDIVGLRTGEVARIGSGGCIDRTLWRVITNLGIDSAKGTPYAFSGEISEDAGTEAGKVRPSLRIFGSSNMAVIYVLIAMNVLVFIAGFLSQATLGVDVPFAYGVQSNELIAEGQYWRLFTAMFLHADIYHLGGNMLSLLYLGMVVSRYFSKREVLSIYLVSGLVGNLLSLVFLPKTLLSLGASGAVMGLGGVLIYMLMFSKNRRAFRSTGNFFSLAIMVFFNLIYGVIRTGSNINNFAHFGGFIAGFIMAFIIEKAVEKKQSREG